MLPLSVLAGLLGCEAPAPDAAWTEPLGSPVAFACDVPVEGPLAAPEPWTSVSEAWLDYLDWFDASPYAGSRAASRAVHDLVQFDGRLFAGVGDQGANPGSLFCAEDEGPCPHADAPGHGIPLYAWDASGQPSWPLVVHEETVERLRRSGDALLVPGTDPTEGDGPPPCSDDGAVQPCRAEDGVEHPQFNRGQVALGSQVWRESGVLDRALHVEDVAWFDGVLFAAGSSASSGTGAITDATLWRSDDGGRTWVIDHVVSGTPGGPERFWLLLRAGDRLVAVGGGDHPPTRHTLAWDGEGWSPLDGVTDGWSHVDGAEPLNETTTLVWGSSDPRGSEPVVEVVGPEGARPVEALADGRLVDASLACDSDLLLLVYEVRDPSAWSVLRTRDLVEFEVLVTWQSGVAYTAVTAWRGGVALGDNKGDLHVAVTAR